MAYELLGKNFIPADVEPKVTGRAKYAEDFRRDGMVFCRLFPGPVPHGRVTRIDTSRAEAMPGVVGVLTTDEVPSHPMNPILNNEPAFIGEPILAVAAVDETTAMDALDAIVVDIEPLDFVVDPLDSLYPGGPNARSEGNSATRGVPVHTNTIPRGPQRGPGQNQMAAALEPILDKAAAALGIDRLEIREINAPRHDSLVDGRRVPVTSAYLVEALEQGAAAFNWREKRALSGRRNGPRVRGVGIGQGFHAGSFAGYDGLVRLTPQGRLHIHTGVGNLGTYSHTATSRVAAEVLRCRWENCVVERGDTNRHLPFNSGQYGSNTSGTQTRTTYAAAMDAVEKLKAIAAMDLGGDASDYDIGEEKVFLRDDPSVALTYPEAARLAIGLGGHYFNRTPVVADMIVNAAVGREQSHGRLQVSTA